MATPDCNACEELREHAPDFVFNGVTDTICTSLQNDTGLNPKATTLHTDCEDLDTANDCMIGRMDKEVDSYDVCDWKDFMHAFIPNLWQLLKGIICALCGIWKKIHKHDCEINYMYQGHKFSIGENPDTSANAYAVAGKGVSFLQADGANVHTSDLHIRYVAGGFGMGGGSFKFYNQDFEEPKNTVVGNFDNGSTYSESYKRKGNTIWDQTGRPASGGELICEFRIKKSAYPQIKHIYRGFGQETGGGGYHVDFKMFDGDDIDEPFAWGQHGWCNETNGDPSATGYDRGHKMDPGWWYLQLRLTYAMSFHADKDGQQYTPQYHFGMRMNQDAIDC